MMDFRSGLSGSVNSTRAVEECFDIAFDGAPEKDCDLIVFHTTVGHNFESLEEPVRDRVRRPLIEFGLRLHRR